MSKNRQDYELSTSPDPQPGAEFALRTNTEGDVTISFSDGSDDLHISRRDFLRVTGVAAATAAMSGAACRAPEVKIVPYVDRPEEIQIGQNLQYATICTACPAQCGAVVKTRAGRPFKMDGNPNHPVSRGALCARGQASYIDMYDPDRARSPMRITGERQEAVTWESLDDAVRNKLREVRRGGAVRILTGGVSSPGTAALLGEIAQNFPNLRHYAYEPLGSDAAAKANEATYGQAGLPLVQFDRADFVLSLGSDFLGTWLSPTEFTRQFASRRTPDGNMNRLVAFETTLTLTGSNADDRFRVRPDDLVYVALAIANEAISDAPRSALSATPAVRQMLSAFGADAVAGYVGGDVTADVIKSTARELVKTAGRSIVIAGGDASRTATGVSLEVAVNLLNALLGNTGLTVDHARTFTHGGAGVEQLKGLIDEINAGRVDVLIVDNTNPVYSAPAELGVAEAFAKVPMLISTSQRLDETSRLAQFLATGTHGLEAWGDSSPRTGVLAIQQPVILPLFDARSFQDSLIHWFGTSEFGSRLASFLVAPEPTAANRPGKLGRPTDAGPWYRYLLAHWQTSVYAQSGSIASFQEFWETALRQGVVTFDAAAQAPAFRPQVLTELLPSTLPTREDIPAGDLSGKLLHLFTTIPMYDGRQANNGHLQELPDPISKHVWGSYLLVSHNTFKATGLKTGEIVSIKTADGKATVSFPVMMQPGLHDDVVAIPFGYGRTSAGVVGDDVGANAFKLQSMIKGLAVSSGTKVSITSTKKVEKVTRIKGAGVIDPPMHRNLASTTLAEYQQNPQAGQYISPVTRHLWPDHDYGDLKWGMAIDMSKCTGCSACVIACQEENNIPVVGRSGILEGREMHWLRIDRYYKLPPEAVAKRTETLTGDPMLDVEPVVAFGEYLQKPRVVFQPMLCQHCDAAPCETVCPVLATMHSEDGLNQMSYQRCVGTRYCANNCPYKVRRYNWFSYSTDRSDSVFARLYPELKVHARLNQVEPLPLGFNPDVTVRDRGVMEKCTFCVQRIRRGKWAIMKEGRRRFNDGEVTTACQDACPAGAIAFGNTMDPTHRVSALVESKRGMRALPDLNTRPAITYLTSVWNTENEHA